MTDRRRLDLTEVDDWLGELSFTNGEVYGAPAPRGPRTSAPSWRRARDILHRAFPGSVVDTGHMRRATRTVNRTQFIVPVDVHGEFGEYVVSLVNNHDETHASSPGADHGYYEDPVLLRDDAQHANAAELQDTSEAAYRERARREFRILAQLAREPSLPFRAPRPIALVLDGAAPVLVVAHVTGVALDSQSPEVRVAASVAAALHQLDIDAPGAVTRRDAALAEIHALERGGNDGHGPYEPLVRDAIAFARSMLPPAEPTRFVHGSLSANRILTSSHPSDDPRPGVIDFNEAARGDPAQELASLTRGMRETLEEFLDEYARAGGAPIEATDVHVYEALQLAWRLRMTSSTSHEPSASAPEALRLVRLLKRS